MSSQRAERVYLVGASLAALGGAVSRRLNNISKSRVRSRGVVGAPIGGWVASIKAALPSELAVVLEAGGNGIPSPAEIQAADQRLRENGFQSPVWVTWPGWTFGRLADARARTTANITAAGVRVCPCTVGSVRSDLLSDETHLSTEGGAKVLQALKSLPDWPQAYVTDGPPPAERPLPLMPSAEIYAAMVEASNRYDVPLALILALTKQESNWNPRAVSRANARGLGQLLRRTAAGLGYPNFDDMFDIRKNLDASAKLLRQLRDTAPASSPDPWAFVLGCYRAGPRAWRQHLAGRPITGSTPHLAAELQRAVNDAANVYIPSITRRVAEYVGG